MFFCLRLGSFRAQAARGATCINELLGSRATSQDLASPRPHVGAHSPEERCLDARGSQSGQDGDQSRQPSWPIHDLDHSIRNFPDTNRDRRTYRDEPDGSMKFLDGESRRARVCLPTCHATPPGLSSFFRFAGDVPRVANSTHSGSWGTELEFERPFPLGRGLRSEAAPPRGLTFAPVSGSARLMTMLRISLGSLQCEKKRGVTKGSQTSCSVTQGGSDHFALEGFSLGVLSSRARSTLPSVDSLTWC